MEKEAEYSAVPWMEVSDPFPNPSTNLPEVIAEESSHIATLIVIILSAVFMIMLIFVVAIFIDCRQEKLAKLARTNKPRRRRMPKILQVLKTIGEDEDSFADKMQTPTDDPGPSSSKNVIV